MHSLLRLACALATVAIPALAVAQSPKPMFNGRDLSGWTVVNGSKDTWRVEGESVVTSGRPIGYMRTDRMYENFVLEMDWKHTNTKDVGNSGLFVWGDALPAVGTGYTRGIEVQVLVNYPDVGWATNHGDIFSIWGAKCKPDRPHPRGIERCLPSENRVKNGEWNHYKVTAKDGSIKLEVNGKEVSGVSECTPRKGYLALEAEGAECRFRNVVITELPTSNPKKEWIATEDRGHVMLHDGLTMAGWTAPGKNWKAGDGNFACSGGEGGLVCSKPTKFGELIFDWKLPAKSEGEMKVTVGGNNTYSYTNGDKSLNDGKWHRLTLKIDGSGIEQTLNGKPHGKPGMVIDQGPITFAAVKGLEIRNVFWAEGK